MKRDRANSSGRHQTTSTCTPPRQLPISFEGGYIRSVRVQESYTRVHQGAAELTKFSRLFQVGSVAHQELIIISEAAPPSRALSCAGLRHPAERLCLSDFFSDSPGIVYHLRSYRLCIAVAHRVPLSTRPLRKWYNRPTFDSLHSSKKAAGKWEWERERNHFSNQASATSIMAEVIHIVGQTPDSRLQAGKAPNIIV